ncbi:MAG TPA: hypothetical protein P5311_01175 [Candidatus Dojkabacteria bacterium]|nr:hypothetical protein [Candidatus Dojkabacteria bacterium]
MNEIEKQPKPGTGVEQVREVLPPTSVEELNPPQEPVASEGLTPPVSVDAETEATPKVGQTGPRLSYGFPLGQNSNGEDPANIVAEKIQGLPPRE